MENGSKNCIIIIILFDNESLFLSCLFIYLYILDVNGNFDIYYTLSRKNVFQRFYVLRIFTRRVNIKYNQNILFQSKLPFIGRILNVELNSKKQK